MGESVVRCDWGYVWYGEYPRNDVFLHRGIDGSYILKIGGLNTVDPKFEGTYDAMCDYLKDIATVSPYAQEMLDKLKVSTWHILHNRYFLD